MVNSEIGLRIKQYRKLKGITQSQLGELIGRTESSIKKYEVGSVDIPLAVIDNIAKNLEIPTELLLYGSGHTRTQEKHKPFLDYLRSINDFVRSNEYECVVMPDTVTGTAYRLSMTELEQIEDFVNTVVKKAIMTFSVDVTDYQEMFANFEVKEDATDGK